LLQELLHILPWEWLAGIAVVIGIPFVCALGYFVFLMIRTVANGGGLLKTPFLTFKVPTPRSPTPQSTTSAPTTAVNRRPATRRLTPLAAELRMLRQRRRVTQGDLAGLLNVDVPFISEVEAGQRNLTRGQLDKIVVEFGLAEPEARILREARAKSVPRKR
jgi:hypothetical protein